MATRKKHKRQKPLAEPSAGRAASPLLGYRYPLLVALVAAPLFAIYTYPYAEKGAMATGIQAYLAAYARMVGAVVALMDPHIIVSGNRIDGRMFSMSIIKTCDAMPALNTDSLTCS
jgi:hypothetical protein